MKRFFIMLSSALLSSVVLATTYSNKTLDDAYSDAGLVAEIYIESARQVVHPFQSDEDEVESCGLNVIASISENFKESAENVIYFHTGVDVQAGESYLLIMPHDQKYGYDPHQGIAFIYNSEQERIAAEERESSISAYCDSKLYDLSVSGFPQEMMSINSTPDGTWLELSLNNIIFPDVVMVQYKEAYVGVAQYVDRLVHYGDLKEYLYELKSRAESTIEVDALD